jgi:hypothetical protein
MHFSTRRLSRFSAARMSPLGPGPRTPQQQPAAAPDLALAARLPRAPQRPATAPIAIPRSTVSPAPPASPPPLDEGPLATPQPSVIRSGTAGLLARPQPPVIEPGTVELTRRMNAISATWSDIRAAVLVRDLERAKSLAREIGVPDLQVGSLNLSDYVQKEKNHLRRIEDGEAGIQRMGSSEPRRRVVGFDLPQAAGAQALPRGPAGGG